MSILSTDFESYLERLIVSHEAHEKLICFSSLLLEENKRHNLVAGSTIPVMWKRHFWDSAQLLPLVPPNARVLVDIGSGAGFPGMVLAVLTGKKVHLIESTGKKARFLEKVAAAIAPNVIIHAKRAEAVRGIRADIVTARAVAPLPDLLPLAEHFWGKETIGLFLKGKNAEAELTQAGKYWRFDVEKHPSLTDSSGVILRIGQLKALKKHGVRRKGP